MKKLLRSISLLGIATLGVFDVYPVTLQELDELWLNPQPQHKPIIIWQWMDGLVTKEGITSELEAFKEAGLAGVQNFQIGGEEQIRISDTKNAIGTANWRALMRHTLDECKRLGLTFGTHNCPGWSSSAYKNVRPEMSMQTIVYSETPIGKDKSTITLPAPAVDPRYNYYEDIAVFAVPSDSVGSLAEMINLTDHFDFNKNTIDISESIRHNKPHVLIRIGQTTNGKTNEAQAPITGQGLECDKLSKKAVKEFWEGYPRMILDIAGEDRGTTFTNFEIDSYEAGGQIWSKVLPKEFKTRRGYDIMPYLPYMAGRIKTIGNEETTKQFKKDWQNTVQECVAENYYGYMTKLAQENGVNLLIEPYGTGGRKPFDILDFYKILQASKGADIATEFWQYPNWGWKDMARHEKGMRKMGKPILLAEAFTCWPLNAWQDSPATLKPMCDKAFCTGVNRMMLHAGATNPWPGVEPGMSFGKWGTQFVPTQTWWKAGGAKALFEYMTRCQALLQQGIPAPEQLPPCTTFKTYHRVADGADIIFICNPTDSAATERIKYDTTNRTVEIWDPYTMETFAANHDAPTIVTIEPYGSRFIIVSDGHSKKDEAPHYEISHIEEISTPWRIEFPGHNTIVADTLSSWHLSDTDFVKYHSGTASYTNEIIIDKNRLPNERIILSLGNVRDMANIIINGQQAALLWKAPYECDITDYVKTGKNELKLEVTNTWANRMIGDEQEPDDLEWSEPLVYTYAPGSPEAGRYLTSNPDWLQKGLPRPSEGRKTVGCFKFFKADSPLIPAGLIGPVKIKKYKHKN